MEKLSELAMTYPNVKIVHFDVEIKNKHMDFKVRCLTRLDLMKWLCLTASSHVDCVNQFQLKDGPRTVAHYGLMLAGVAGLPSPVIESAKSIISKITQKVNFQNQHVSFY